MKIKTIILLHLITFGFLSCSDDTEYTSIPNQKELLGKKIFFDKSLSNPVGQSCASCHNPEKGFSDPKNTPISEGAVQNTFGNRNAPTLSYNVFSPSRFYNTTDETYIGGFFYDGRTNSLTEQAIKPMLNPAEMNNKSIHEIAEKIKTTPYFSEIVALYGDSSTDNDIMNNVVDALSVYETSKEVNSFTSKFDYYSKQLVAFTEDEKKGLDLFAGKAKCAQCHVLDADPNTGKVLFTDFSYDNLGIPKNNSNPFYNQSVSINPLGSNYIDLGIGAIVNQEQHNGKFKVPSLRNVAVSGPYYHNGAIKTLKEAIHFYNVRDLSTSGFEAPEYNKNVNNTELGDLKLTEIEEKQIEKFLETLTDHYRK
jgi:cytochrome c peroxidase